MKECLSGYRKHWSTADMKDSDSLMLPVENSVPSFFVNFGSDESSKSFRVEPSAELYRASSLGWKTSGKFIDWVFYSDIG